jgi:hypothetical protein
LYNKSARRPSQNTKLKDSDLAPIINVELLTKEGIVKCRTLVDSGASGCVLDWDKARHFKIKTKPDSHVLTTVMGSLDNNKSAKAKFKLPQFSPTLELEWEVDVIPDMSNMPYDMILGRDVMKELNLDVLSSDLTITMGHVKIPWTNRTAKSSSLFNIDDDIDMDDSADRVRKILDAKYEPAKLDEIVAECDLSPDQKIRLLSLLEKYESLFDGTLGTLNMEPYDIELADDAKPYHLKRAYTVPQAYIKTLKMEVERLVELGILEEINDSEWAAGTFIIPKKDATVRFLSDFRELNKRIKRKPFPIPKIQELMLLLEGFRYATSLDLNMGYYHIKLLHFHRIYVLFCCLGVNTGISAYQWALKIPQIFSKKRCLD